MSARDAYDEGQQAAAEGKPVWANPYSSLSDPPSDFHAWFAGWCNWMRDA